MSPIAIPRAEEAKNITRKRMTANWSMSIVSMFAMDGAERLCAVVAKTIATASRTLFK